MRRALAAEGVSCRSCERMRGESRGLDETDSICFEAPNCCAIYEPFLAIVAVGGIDSFCSRYKPSRAMGLATRAQIS